MNSFRAYGKTFLYVLLAFLGILANSARGQTGARKVIEIELIEKDWGDASPADIRKVLESAAQELLVLFPEKTIIRVQVRRHQGAPQVNFQKSPTGQYVVLLATGDRFWSQYAYQFAHELCHILSNYERRHENGVGNENLWFDESLCELASLFVLRRMGETWKTAPPYSNWKDYNTSLTKYAADILRKEERKLKTDQTLAQWLQENLAAMRLNPVLREKNGVVANHLLPFFEKTPEHWEAIAYLNLGRPEATNSLESYLENWYFSAPRKHKAFIKKIVDELGIKSAAIDKHAKS